MKNDYKKCEKLLYDFRIDFIEKRSVLLSYAQKTSNSTKSRQKKLNKCCSAKIKIIIIINKPLLGRPRMSYVRLFCVRKVDVKHQIEKLYVVESEFIATYNVALYSFIYTHILLLLLLFLTIAKRWCKCSPTV